MNSSRIKKGACTVSAAALMLGVSSAATIGLHFQDNYCGSPAYSGYPVTQTAFGIGSNGWENLTEMSTGYNSCAGPVGYTLSELIDNGTSTGGLNPLPNGSLNVTWFGPTANFSLFAGYAGPPPYYCNSAGPLDTNTATGEEEIYATFLRDGINFGPDSSGGNNDQPGYSVDITGLKSLFTNSPFVVELIASSDSMETLTNALVIDLTNSITNSVGYPSTPLPDNTQGTSYYQGEGGGLSTVSGVFTNTDAIRLMSVQPEHVAGEFNRAGTISGFIVTDKPVVSMSPRSVLAAGAGDTILLNPYAIGVPPLSYQWRLNGRRITVATNSSYAISNLGPSAAGAYDVVVTNLYGAATSKVSTVTVAPVDEIAQTLTHNIVYDSNPANPQHDGVNMGAAWAASNSDGTTNRTGVMSFTAAKTNGITVPDSAAFNGPAGTITFWMQSAGTDTSANGNAGASLFCRPADSPGDDFVLLQQDSGSMYFQSAFSINTLTSAATVSDSKWHFVALTFDQATNGGASFYIDGALDSTNANPGAWSWPAGQPLEIGYSSDTYWRDYNGVLDDVRYYSAALTPSQLSTIYASGNAGALADSADLQMQFNFTAPPGQGIILTWRQSGAVLQTAPTVTGPWKDLPGVGSPYTIVPAATAQYFRYRYVPQTLVSNPYLM